MVAKNIVRITLNRRFFLVVASSRMLKVVPVSLSLPFRGMIDSRRMRYADVARPFVVAVPPTHHLIHVVPGSKANQKPRQCFYLGRTVQMICRL